MEEGREGVREEKTGESERGRVGPAGHFKGLASSISLKASEADKMHKWWWLAGAVGVLVPLVTTLVTYTFVSMGSDALVVDDTGALIIMLAFIKLVLLGTQGIFPIDLDAVYNNIINRGKRSINSTAFEVPEVSHTPCVRRFLCELEAAARTSDNYLPRGPNEVDDGRNLDEEVAPEEVDPIHEMQVEAIRALFREEDPTGELSERGQSALAVVGALTGTVCEEAYALCKGRFTAPMAYKAIFEEINMVIRDHD
ncbi:hypothetical protein Pcinc_008526 [Petrolisthes cinctipes]|uniref:Uncharacterized protein n=1 Tax=Petrolisthes cinctipes TaxID=88211 RepID=A0AAE1KZE6_PETCI|nr:hypothetical protein Pcinc_008526 [Petrolisthes cinctipes]